MNRFELDFFEKLFDQIDPLDHPDFFYNPLHS